MEFDIKIWRGYYDRVNELGQYIKELPIHDNEGIKELREELRSEQQTTIEKSDKYLDMCKLKSDDALWQYKVHDESTWISSEKFKYLHLVQIL